MLRLGQPRAGKWGTRRGEARFPYTEPASGLTCGAFNGTLARLKL